MCNVSIYFRILFGHSCCIYFLEMILILPLRQRCCVHVSCKAQPFGWCPPLYKLLPSINITMGSAPEGKMVTRCGGHRFDRRALHLMITFSWETVEDSWTLRQQIWALVKDPLLTMWCGQLLGP